jgi:hypothetical protein
MFSQDGLGMSFQPFQDTHNLTPKNRFHLAQQWEQQQFEGR